MALASALEDLVASVTTPDGGLGARIAHRDQVSCWLANGVWEKSSATDLEVQLGRLGKLLFVERMRAYYQARSKDFGYLITREEPPLGRRDQEYVEARSRVLSTGRGGGGLVEVSAVGMTQWAVRIDRTLFAQAGEAAFVDAASQAGSALVADQFSQIRTLKREIYADEPR